MKCTQRLYPPDLTQCIQPVDRHIGVQYKLAVYQAIRSASMRLIEKNEGASSVKLKPMVKRVLITKIVADTHERLAANGSFERAFLATGTWIPKDLSGDSVVDLQGVDMKYEHHITPEKITDHRRKVEEAEAKEQEIRKAAIRKVEEKEAAIMNQLSPAVETSMTVWPALYPIVKEATRSSFDIASYIDGDFICAGSFPAASLASVWTANSDSTEPLELLFNDIDIYHGAFGEGKI